MLTFFRACLRGIVRIVLVLVLSAMAAVAVLLVPTIIVGVCLQAIEQQLEARKGA